MAVALFFFSCEDENTILGFKNPVPKFNVSFVEIPLASNVQLIDSVNTDNWALNSAGDMLVGRYQDNTFGTVEAQPYLQIFPRSLAQIPATAVFDSLTLSLRYNFYGYGFAGQQTEKFTVHEVTEKMDRTNATRYQFNNRPLAYDPQPMDEASITLSADYLKKQIETESSKQDTLLARARLSDALGMKIFNLVKTYNFVSPTPPALGPSATTQLDAFLDEVRGITLIPTESNAVLGFRVSSPLSTVTLHYHTIEAGAVKDTLTRAFGFNLSSFTKISNDRTGTALATAQPYQSVSELSSNGTRYLQAGNPVVTKLDLSNFYVFADSIGNGLINEATLVVGGVETPLGTPPLNALGLKLLKNNNQFFNSAMRLTDRAAMDKYAIASGNSDGVLVGDGNHYFVRSDAVSSSAPAVLGYSDGQYSGYLTLFLQKLLRNKDKGVGGTDSRIEYLALYPLEPSISSSVTRTAFNAANVKLRIYYTKPTLTTTPN